MSRLASKKHKLIALVAAAVAAVFVVAPASASSPRGRGHGDGHGRGHDRTAHDVSANLFEWNWPSVANECTTVLGPAGYGSVQVAPPQDSLKRTSLGNGSDTVLHPWWEVYQPVDYNLTSRMGNESQFRSMVATCRHAGVHVIVDTVINHMTGQGNTSYGGVTYSKYNYAGLYTPADFHSYPADCPVPPDNGSGSQEGSIQDFNDYTQVFNCELVGLSDLRTQSNDVRHTLADYLNKLLGYGVSGFRVDAAKHIGVTDLAAIEALLNRTVDGTRPFFALEVMPGSPGELSPTAFEHVGDLLGFDYADQLQAAFKSYNQPAQRRQHRRAEGVRCRLRAAAERQGTRVRREPRHRTQRVDAELQGPEQHDRQRVHAGLAARHAAGVRELRVEHPGRLSAVGRERHGHRHGLRQHDVGLRRPLHRRAQHGRLPQLRGRRAGDELVRRRREPHRVQPRHRGFFSTNNEGAAKTVSVQTGLSGGTYCDIIHGSVQTNGTCSGPTVTVDQHGFASITVGSYDSVAFTAHDKVH